MQIHEKIRQERVLAKLTEDQMAEKLQEKRSTYQYWEKKTPSIDKIKRVAIALGKPEDYFFVNQDEGGNQDDEITINQIENEKDHRMDDLIRIAEKNADAVVSSTKSVERLTAMLEARSNSEREKNVSNLENYAGLIEVIREIGIKAGYWKGQDKADEELRRFVAFHKL